MPNSFYSIIMNYLNIITSYLHTFFAFLFDNPLTQNIYTGVIYIFLLIFLLYLFIYSFLKMAKNNLLTKNIYVVIISLCVGGYIFFASLKEEPIKKTRSQETDFNLLLYLVFIIFYSLYTTPNIFNYVNINLSNIIITDQTKIDNILKYMSLFFVFILSIFFLVPLKVALEQLNTSNLFGKMGMVIFFILGVILFLSITNKILGFAKINYTNTSDFDLLSYFKMLSLFLIAAPILLYSIFSSVDEIIKFIKYNYGVIIILMNIILFPVFYNTIFKTLLGKYTYVIITIQLLIFLYFFYVKTTSTTSESIYSVLYERIKYILLFFLLLLFITIIYILDKENQSGYIKNLHLITLFMGLIFIYLLITLDLKFDSTFKIFKELYYDKCNEESSNILDLKPNNILLLFIGFVFLLSCLIIFIGIVNFPGGFLNNENNSPYILIILSLYFLIWFLFFIIKIFPKVLSTPITPNTLYTTNKITRAYMTLLSFLIVFISLSYALQFLHNLKSGSNILSSFINVVLIIIIYLIIKNFIFPQPEQPSTKSETMKSLNNLIAFLREVFTIENFKQLIKSPTVISSIIICIVILPYILYDLIKKQKSTTPNSVILLDNETSLQNKKMLATYQELNTYKIPDNYNYAISFWVYINAVPKYDNKQHTIISYDDNPMIKFDTLTNTLIVSIKPYNSIQHDNIIVVKQFKLQKWNNIIINYTPGHLDIFINTKLVFTIEQNLTYLETSYLYVGDDNGLNGVVNNVEYFKSPLNKNEIISNYSLSKYLIE
jgi:hypothetical protein